MNQQHATIMKVEQMNESSQSQNDSTPASGTRRRNIILGVILAVAAIGMYVSIFFRLSYNPLS